MINTGLNRNIIDQFYTNTNISKKCIDITLNYLKIDKNIDIILEPSAGDGSFSDYFNMNNYNLYSYDLYPKKDYIKKQNFLELDETIFNNKKVHTIGNPPFGKQSSTARKFIKKLCKFSDSISFILPKSFRKDSYQKSFSLNFHLIYECDIEKNAFIIDNKIHDVPCVYQIWIKKDFNRPEKLIYKENGFKFIKKPQTMILEYDINNKPIKKKNVFNEIPDFAILRAGGGKNCGKISLNYNDGIKCYPEAWYFIKLDNKYNNIYIRDIFYKKYNEINWYDDSNVGARSINKQKFIKNINEILESLDISF